MRTQQASTASRARASTGRSSVAPSESTLGGSHVRSRRRSRRSGRVQRRRTTEPGRSLVTSSASPSASKPTAGLAAEASETAPSGSQWRPRSNEIAVAIRLTYASPAKTR